MCGKQQSRLPVLNTTKSYWGDPPAALWGMTLDEDIARRHEFHNSYHICITHTVQPWQGTSLADGALTA